MQIIPILIYLISVRGIRDFSFQSPECLNQSGLSITPGPMGRSNKSPSLSAFGQDFNEHRRHISSAMGTRGYRTTIHTGATFRLHLQMQKISAGILLSIATTIPRGVKNHHVVQNLLTSTFIPRYKEYQAMATSAFVDVEGVDNFRDLGGYLESIDTHKDVRVRRGVVYRSAHISRITPNGAEQLRNGLKLKRIFDLRSYPELSDSEDMSSYDNLTPGVERVVLPVFPEQGFSPYDLVERYQDTVSRQIFLFKPAKSIQIDSGIVLGLPMQIS